MLAAHLLDSFNPISKAGSHVGGIHVARQDLAWVLNGYQRLWRVTSTWLHNTGSDTMDAQSQICAHFLECLSRLCNHELSIPCSLSCNWPQMLAEILTVDGLDQMAALQHQLGRLLDILAEMPGRSKMFARHMEDIMLPTLIFIKNKSSVFEILEPVLQVVNPISFM